jgi:glycosyltransferase involved in cell wall biosynthesis
MSIPKLSRRLAANVINFPVRCKDRLFSTIVRASRYNLGKLRQYEPKATKWDRLPSQSENSENRKFLIVTPSLNQSDFIEETIQSVLDQNYSNLKYIVMDGASTDGSPDIIRKYEGRIHHWESKRDGGQTKALKNGFEIGIDDLEADDIMAWINSDDVYVPGLFHYVSSFFDRNPTVDVVYGHRIIIDNTSKEVGRWVLPKHCNSALNWVDYIPQETMFWRKRIWDKVHGLNSQFDFAMDWDLIYRFKKHGAKFMRLPYFLGAFRVHEKQKTHLIMKSVGAVEIDVIRRRNSNQMKNRTREVVKWSQREILRGSIYSQMLKLGIRY